MGGRGSGGKRVSSGFRCNEYRPLRLESCFCLFQNLSCEDLTFKWAMGGSSSCICKVFCLMMTVYGRLPSFALLLCPDSGLSLNVCWTPRPGCCLCPSVLPSRGHTPIFHCYHIIWGYRKCQTASAALVSVLPCPAPHLLCLLPYAHRQMSQCTDPSDMFVCWAGNSLLNYICPTYCNFKGRDLEVFLWCHTADLTSPSILFLIQSIWLLRIF